MRRQWVVVVLGFLSGLTSFLTHLLSQTPSTLLRLNTTAATPIDTVHLESVIAVIHRGSEGLVSLGGNAFLVTLPMEEHYNHLWRKTRQAVEFVHSHYPTSYDWALKIDDDAFIVIENLRLFLLDVPQEDPHYFGCNLKSFGGYNQGGAGFVMSRVNVEKLIRVFKQGGGGCKGAGPEAYGLPEDVEISKCLRKVGVTKADTRDPEGGFRFSPFDPIRTMHHELIDPKYNWFWGFTNYKLINIEGPGCCSDTFISFHYIKADLMLTLEYLIYGLHPFSSRDVWKGYPPIPTLTKTS